MPGGAKFPTNDVVENAGNGQGTVLGDAQPFGDDCSNRDQVQLSADNKNIGDLLNTKNVTWGYFQGGFKPTSTKPDGTAVCGGSHNVGNALGGTGKSGQLPLGTKADYIPHHEPFQYYPSTANPHHLAPGSVDKIGQTDSANHQYDLTDFWASRRTPSPTSSITRKRIRPRSSGSSRTTGAPAASVTIRSTPAPACWTTCSTLPGTRSRRWYSTRRPEIRCRCSVTGVRGGRDACPSDA
jgi:hypothetical protein